MTDNNKSSNFKTNMTLDVVFNLLRCCFFLVFSICFHSTKKKQEKKSVQSVRTILDWRDERKSFD